MTDKHTTPINPNNSDNPTDPANTPNYSEDLQKPHLCISEVGTSSAKPDIYEIWLHIEQEHPDDTKALEMVVKVASDLKSYLKSLKDVNIDVSLSEYKLRRETYKGTDKKWKKDLSLSIASVDVIAKLDNVNTTYDIISHAIWSGVTSISNMKFKLLDEHAEAEEAIAIRNAMTKATVRVKTIANLMDTTFKNPEMIRVCIKLDNQSLSNEEREAVVAATFSDIDILHNMIKNQYIRTTAIIDLVYEYNKIEFNEDDLIVYNAEDRVVRRNRDRFYDMLKDEEEGIGDEVDEIGDEMEDEIDDEVDEIGDEMENEVDETNQRWR